MQLLNGILQNWDVRMHGLEQQAHSVAKSEVRNDKTEAKRQILILLGCSPVTNFLEGI